MFNRTITIPGDKGELTVEFGFVNGTVIVRKGSEVLSRKWAFGLTSDHGFPDPGEPDGPDYRLRVGGYWGYYLRRDDRIVALQDKKVLRYINSFGLTFSAVIIVEFIAGFVAGLAGTDLSWIRREVPEALVSIPLAVPLFWWLGRKLRAPWPITSPDAGGVRDAERAVPE